FTAGYSLSERDDSSHGAPRRKGCRLSDQNALKAASPRLFRGAQHLGHRFDELTPRGGFGPELLPPPNGEPIEFRAAIVLGELPLGLDPPALLEAVQRRIQRSLADGEHF